MTSANDNSAKATGEISPVAKATQQVEAGQRLLAAIPEHPEAKGSLMRVAAKYLHAAAERLEAASRS